jgi:dihydropteroate synthase
VKLILKTFKNAIISIDTFRSDVAKKALDNGALIVNDVSGGDLDSNMYKIVGKFNVPYIMMHMKGTPKNMQNNPQYKNVTVEIIKNLSQKIKKAESFNIRDIILDPGFGFGKTTNHNFKLLNDLRLFKNLDRPVLVGVSRKSMIYKTLDIKPENALNGTTSLNTIALLNGANILRVHDVKEAKEVIKLYNFGKKNV